MRVRTLTLAYVKAGGLREAIRDELKGLGAGVRHLCQLLDAAAPEFVVHTLL